jgi:DNA-binding response OmpR family regulator
MGEPQIVVNAPSSPDKPPRPRVLAVDDQVDSLRLLQLRLQSAGIQCFTCPNGPAALKFLEETLVDVIILDVMMPEMDGFEVCRRLKANESTRDIPVLFLTAKLDPADRIKGLEVGGHDYLSKPTEQQELLARTRAAMRVKDLQDRLKEQLHLQQRINQLQEEMLDEQWDKTFGQLAASLAHEINNPLAAALGSVELLGLDEMLSPEVRQRLEVIKKSLDRAGKKLKSLLLIAQTNRQTQMIDMGQMVEDLVALINHQAMVSKVAIVSKIDQKGEWYGSPTELARAVLYILNKAIESVARKPAARVLIRTEKRDGVTCLCVSDNGPLISLEVQKNIFEPVFSAKGAAPKDVGLYLASKIIEEAGGSLTLSSPSSDGTNEFTIRISPKLYGSTSQTERC